MVRIVVEVQAVKEKLLQEMDRILKVWDCNPESAREFAAAQRALSNAYQMINEIPVIFLNSDSNLKHKPDEIEFLEVRRR